ncbi:hypothetical protein HY213_03010 [Candidatus Peregrinibacteria bacterium]|nr:hypothetical protein [Candidatus Peregrinibacteria bacterium]
MSRPTTTQDIVPARDGQDFWTEKFRVDEVRFVVRKDLKNCSGQSSAGTQMETSGKGKAGMELSTFEAMRARLAEQKSSC